MLGEKIDIPPSASVRTVCLGARCLLLCDRGNVNVHVCECDNLPLLKKHQRR